MPKIRTYEQQISAPSGAVQSSASPETAGAPGRALAQLGGTVANFGEVLHKNEVNEDVTNAHEELSRIRNDYTLRIQDETQKGSIDTEKIMTQYQDDLNKITGSVKTREGKRYLERQGGTLGSYITRSSAISQAQVKGKRAVESWQNAIALNGNTLQSDPAGFDGVLKDTIESIDAQVSGGVLSIEQADKLKRLSESQLAENAAAGWMKINADTAKDLLDQGVYDKHLTPSQKEGLYKDIKAYKSAENTEKERFKKLQEDQKAKVSEAWEQENLDNLHENSITPKQILESPLKSNRKIQWLNMMEQNLKQKLQTDPTVKNDLVRRMFLPEDDPSKINDMAQVYKYVGNGLSLTDVKQMTTFLEKTPEGKRLKDNRSMLLKQADATLVKRDPITGQPDPQGPYSLSLFTNALMDAEERVRKDGKDVSELYNPTSKEYFGHQILKYMSSPQERFQRQMNFQGFNNPSGVKESRHSGESPAEYFKRLGK